MKDQFNTHDNKDIEITHLKAEAKRSDNKLRSFFESSSVIHLLIDTDLNLIDYNRAAKHFIRKYHGVEINPGTKITSCLHNRHHSTFLDCYQKALAGIPSRLERIFNYGKERIIWFLAYEPATDSEGKVIGMSFNAVDITEKIACDYKISSQFHSLHEIAHIQSHNMRRPVSNISGLMNIFRVNGYATTKKGLLMLEKAVADLELQLAEIERFAR
jgi:PAS domain S-box-containing protein